MNIELTEKELEIVNLLIYGHNSNVICEWFGIEKKDFKKIKLKIFKKLKITRTIQLLKIIIDSDNFQYRI